MVKPQFKKGGNMKQPNGTDLLEMLANLLAEQNGVKITYEIIGEQNEEEST